MSKFAAKLKQCSDDQEMAECAVEALHEAIGALKHLSAVMMRSALFWKQMQEHCTSLADPAMKEEIKMLLNESKDIRLQAWTSKGFKRKAIHFYSGWVALNSVCTVYMEQIKETQKDLYKYITENPSYEESKKNILILSDKFMADLKEDQEDLKERKLKTQEKNWLWIFRKENE